MSPWVSDAKLGRMKVIARIRKLNDEHTGPAEPAELSTVEGEADAYDEARDAAAANVPDGWQLLDFIVPDHHPN